MKNRAYLDILLLVSLFVIPKLSFVSSIFNYYDELVFIFMLFTVVHRVILKHKKLLFPVSLFFYILYSFFLIYYNTIPISHVMQIFISSKFLIIFLYFYTYSDKYKVYFFNKLMKFVIFIFIISFILSILQFVLPSYFGGYTSDGRGWHGINAGGIFFSRISYSSFLLMCIILLMSIKINSEQKFNRLIKHRYKILFIALFLLVLTFARKELVLSLMLLLYLFKDRVKSNSKIVFYLILFSFIVIALMLFAILYSDLNNATFTEKQVRYLMLLSSLNIFEYYFPFGSGPGTYGSIMSIDYTTVYEAFNVPRHIYLGYGDDIRGPIFDLYLVGVMAEYGMGILFFLWFLKKMALSASPQNMDQYINTKKAKIALVLQLFIVAIFVPIFSNWIGFLIFSMLGTLSSGGKRNG